MRRGQSGRVKQIVCGLRLANQIQITKNINSDTTLATQRDIVTEYELPSRAPTFG